MSKILLDWLNLEVRLSREVFSLEDDFINGYLIGEILHSHNQISDFDKFIDKYTPEAKVKNFCLLEPTLRQLGIFFNARIAGDIIHAKKGVNKNMLYELRTIIESVKKRSTLSTTTGQKLLRVIQPSKPSFDKSKADTFRTALRALVENANDVMMGKHLEKYQSNKSDFRESVTLGHMTGLSLLDSYVQKTKQLKMYQKAHDKEFMDAWELINQRKWKENQRIAKKRRELVEKLQNNATNKQESTLRGNREDARNSTISGIDGFDARLRTEVFREDLSNTNVAISIKTIPAQSEKGIPKMSYLDRESLHNAMVESQKAMKEHSEDLQIKQQIHGRRIRKFVRERESNHTKLLSSSAEFDVLNQLLKPSSAERLEQQIKTKILFHKDFFTDNRKYRTQIENERENKDFEIAAEWRAEEAIREFHWIIKARIYAQHERLDALVTSQSSADRRGSTDIVMEVIDRLLDATDWVVSCRAVSLLKNDVRDEPLPSHIWSDAMRAFSSPEDMALSWPPLMPSNVVAELPYSLSEKPLCADSSWLFSKVFDGEVGFTCNPQGHADDEVQSVANYLAKLDCDAFLSFISSFEGAEAEASPSVTAIGSPVLTARSGRKSSSRGATPSDGRTAEKKHRDMLPPFWMTMTSPQYLLGEAVVETRCTCDPVPEDPLPTVAVPHLPLRLALWGISDRVRASVALALSEKFEVSIIRIKDLVERAFVLGGTLVDKPDDDCLPLELLSKNVFNMLMEGLSVDDARSISLILKEIQRISEVPNCRGYVLEDFPNKFEEARALVEALSGIDYGLTRPSSLDKASAFVTPSPKEVDGYDVKKCGLDAVVFFENDMDALLMNRFGERRDLRTGEKIFLTEDTVDSIEFCGTIMKPEKPAEMYAIQLNMNMGNADMMRQFLQHLEIIRVCPVKEFEVLEDVVDDIIARVSEIWDMKPESKTVAAGEEVAEENIPDDSNVIGDPNIQSENAVPVDELGGLEDVGPDSERVKTPFSVDNTQVDAEVPVVLDNSPVISSIPKLLADALNRIWNVSENQSLENLDKFFKALRGIRFQTLQRRRAMHDVLCINLVAHDDRQSIFEDFRKGFNEIDEDFRYDLECISELHLRTQELRDRLWSMTENRKKEAESILKKFANDGSCTLSIYTSQCQGVALVQAETNRFIAGIHVLLDLFYASRKRTIKDMYVGNVEEAAPVPGLEQATAPTGSATKGGKPKEPQTPKDKKAPKKQMKDLCGDNVPRAPLGPMILSASLSELPEADVKMEEDDDANSPTKAKAKAKASTKGKKMTEERGVATDPLGAAVEKAFEAADLWARGSFMLNRSSYGSDESYCSSLENVIWFEVDRFKRTLNAIADVVADQCVWLATKDAEFLNFLKATIQERQLREFAVTERLIALIQITIDDFSPIREEWLIASDSLVIKQSCLVYPADIPHPTPEIIDFFEDHLNDEQISASQEMLRHMQVGKIVLQQDLADWLNRAEKSVGPIAVCSCDKGQFLALTWPRKWRGINIDAVVENVLGNKTIPGGDETMGGVPIESVMARLQTLSVGDVV